MRLKIYQVDAFARDIFSGNPAAVIPLEKWLDDDTMLNIAAENNLSETAFFVKDGEYYELRWFTPKEEVPLCGHATLASAAVIFEKLQTSRQNLKFKTQSGILEINKLADNQFELQLSEEELFPQDSAPTELLEGLGISAQADFIFFTKKDTNYYIIYNHEDIVKSANPNLSLLEKLHPYGVSISAPGEKVDFVTRYFAPSYGIPEDPVTGSIYCALTPYWSERLEKKEMLAEQLSERGGKIKTIKNENRVILIGQTHLYLEGEIFI